MNFIGKIPNGFNQLSQSAIAVTVDGVNQAIFTTSSFTVNQTITGSLFGTASYVSGSVFTSTNPALSASYAPDTTFPYTGSAIITGSLTLTGSLAVNGSMTLNNVFNVVNDNSNHVATFTNSNTGNGDGIKIKLSKTHPAWDGGAYINIPNQYKIEFLRK